MDNLSLLDTLVTYGSLGVMCLYLMVKDWRVCSKLLLNEKEKKDE